MAVRRTLRRARRRSAGFSPGQDCSLPGFHMRLKQAGGAHSQLSSAEDSRDRISPSFRTESPTRSQRSNRRKRSELVIPHIRRLRGGQGLEEEVELARRRHQLNSTAIWQTQLDSWLVSPCGSAASARRNPGTLDLPAALSSAGEGLPCTHSASPSREAEAEHALGATRCPPPVLAPLGSLRTTRPPWRRICATPCPVGVLIESSSPVLTWRQAMLPGEGVLPRARGDAATSENSRGPSGGLIST